MSVNGRKVSDGKYTTIISKTITAETISSTELKSKTVTADELVGRQTVVSSYVSATDASIDNLIVQKLELSGVRLDIKSGSFYHKSSRTDMLLIDIDKNEPLIGHVKFNHKYKFEKVPIVMLTVSTDLDSISKLPESFAPLVITGNITSDSFSYKICNINYKDIDNYQLVINFIASL